MKIYLKIKWGLPGPVFRSQLENMMKKVENNEIMEN